MFTLFTNTNKTHYWAVDHSHKDFHDYQQTKPMIMKGNSSSIYTYLEKNAISLEIVYCLTDEVVA